MFGVSGFEFLVILVVGVFLMRPKDVALILSWYKKLLKKFYAIKAQAQEFIDDAAKEAGIDQDGKYIVDMDGKLQRAYDVKSLMKGQKHNRAKKRNNKALAKNKRTKTSL